MNASILNKATNICSFCILAREEAKKLWNFTVFLHSETCVICCLLFIVLKTKELDNIVRKVLKPFLMTAVKSTSLTNYN